MFKLIFKLTLMFALFAPFSVAAQTNSEFGPNVQSYLDYLKQELTVTDLRESQREVRRSYIQHNYNRVNALRQFAIKLARKTDNDFMPELDAVTQKEFPTLFTGEQPRIADLRENEIYDSVYRYLGTSKSTETFYIFARLNPFEEQAVRETQQNKDVTSTKPTTKKTVIFIKDQAAPQKIREKDDETVTQIETKKPNVSPEQFIEDESSPKFLAKPQKP
ncbi:MAG: hypothetical protein H7Z37_01265 [Pyrinomonadaceae bacterium]|nr:hypothetical protein [Pyrinomonadaceae bacterium]